MLYGSNGTGVPIHRKNTFITHDQMSLKELLLAHQGITVDLYAGHVAEEVKAGSVVPILEGWERAPWTMCLVTRLEAEHNRPRLHELAEWFIVTPRSPVRSSWAYRRRWPHAECRGRPGCRRPS